METKAQKTAGGWFCSYCQRGVDPSEVTFRETHEVCGRMIANDEPPAVDIVTQRDHLLSVNKQLERSLLAAQAANGLYEAREANLVSALEAVRETYAHSRGQRLPLISQIDDIVSAAIKAAKTAQA